MHGARNRKESCISIQLNDLMKLLEKLMEYNIAKAFLFSTDAVLIS